MGFKVIVENRYEGMLYQNEIFEKIEVGDRRNGFIKQVRNDGLVDALLQPMGAAKALSDTQKILDQLEKQRGILPYNYKTDPDTINDVFGLSRKAFKRALTQLIDAGSVITSYSIHYTKLYETGVLLKRNRLDVFTHPLRDNHGINLIVTCKGMFFKIDIDTF